MLAAVEQKLYRFKAYLPHSIHQGNKGAETEEDLIERLNEWKDNVETKGVRVNMNKTKVLISGERQKPMQKSARWPCDVCGTGLVVFQYSVLVLVVRSWYTISVVV